MVLLDVLVNMQHFPSYFLCLILWSTTNVIIIIEFLMFWWQKLPNVEPDQCCSFNHLSQQRCTISKYQNIFWAASNSQHWKKNSLKRPSSRLINEAKRLGWFWNFPAVDWWTAPSTINKSCLTFAKCHTEWDKCAAGRGRNKTQNHP